jgi:hypothetical protein
MFGHGAENKDIPDYFWNKLSLRQKNIFLENYLLGDGNVFSNEETSTYSRISFVTISKSLAYRLTQFLYNIGITPSIAKKDAVVDKKGVNHRDCWFVHWVKDKRKQKNGIRRCKEGLLSRVRQINKKTYNGYVYDIEVDNHHKFICEFILVHNCIYDPIGQKSSNRYRSGGPAPFQIGNCPMCNSVGKLQSEEHATIKMTIDWRPKNFEIFGPNIRLPSGGIVTRGYITDLPKVEKCDKMMIVNPGMQSYGHYSFKLAGEVVEPFQIIQNKFFAALWQRVG